MELGLALYVSAHTAAPTVMVAILLIVNTAAVALFQVRLSRRADSVEAGARALVRGAWWIAAGFADRRARRPGHRVVRRSPPSSPGPSSTSSAR